MKRNTFLIFCLALFFVCGSCKNSNQSNGKNKSTIIVKIPNAENKELVLSVQGEDFENRQTKKIRNGKAIFDVLVKKSDVVWVESLYNLDNFSNMRDFIPILLENDTIIVHSELKKDSIQIDENEYETRLLFQEHRFEQGKRNIGNSKASKQLFSIGRGLIFNLSKLDSMNATIFPKIRQEHLNLFTNEFSDLDDRVQLELLSHLLSFFEFKPKYLSQSGKESINQIFTRLTGIESSADYRYQTVKDKISSINDYVENKKVKLTFTDFTLKSIDGASIVLSKIAKENNFTILYFWVAGCGPCKRFNQKITPQIIDELREEGIEIIHINNDFYQKNWKRATEQDSIFWMNLYAGNMQYEIEKAYNVRAYPTKVTVDRDLNVIDFEFTNPDDLKKLKSR